MWQRTGHDRVKIKYLVNFCSHQIGQVVKDPNFEFVQLFLDNFLASMPTSKECQASVSTLISLDS